MDNIRISPRTLAQILLLLLATIGVLSTNSYNLLPSTLVFELLFLLCITNSSFRTSKLHLFLATILSSYLLYTLNYSVVFKGANLGDYITIHKSFVYLILLLLFKPKVRLNVKSLDIFYKSLLALFFIKYSYSVFLGINDRPGIYTENNFELIFLLLLFISRHFVIGGSSLKLILLTTFVFFISGSRSSLAALIVVLFFLKSSGIKLKDLGFYILLIFSVLGFVLVFNSRLGTGSLETIDRLKFLLAFIDQTKEWGLKSWILGAEPITALNTEVCTSLDFYKSLFSKSGDGSCYSVIFHSYVLRVIFDHGVLGLFFSFFVLYKLITFGNLPFKAVVMVITVIFFSSLSVSALNNAYTMLGVWFILYTGQSLNSTKGKST